MKFTEWLSLRESKKTETKKEFFDDGHKERQKKKQTLANKKPQFE